MTEWIGIFLNGTKANKERETMKLGFEHFAFGVSVGLTIWGISRWLERRERRPENMELGARIIRATFNKQPPVSHLK